MKNAVINLSICLSDIPKDKIKQGKNGKLYLGVNVRQRKEPDQYGQDIYAYVAQSKEARAAEEKRQFIGNGNYIDFDQMKPEDVAAMQTAPNVDDLPF